MTDGRRLAFRWAAVAFLAHAVVVVALSGARNLLWGEVSFDWEAGHALRVVDLPVYWAIEHSARQITHLPSGFARLGWRWTSFLLEGSFHAVIGGAFYALLAALVAFVIYRRRQRRALAASASSS